MYVCLVENYFNKKENQLFIYKKKSFKLYNFK